MVSSSSVDRYQSYAPAPSPSFGIREKAVEDLLARIADLVDGVVEGRPGRVPTVADAIVLILARQGIDARSVDFGTVGRLGRVGRRCGPAFESTVAELRGAGFEVEDGSELWGAARAFAIAPGGHRVELMAAPPPTRP